MSLEKAKKYLESKGCLNWKECATPRAGWMCAKRRKRKIKCESAGGYGIRPYGHGKPSMPFVGGGVLDAPWANNVRPYDR